MGKRIGILGAGGWGTALAVLLSTNGHKVILWEFRKDAAIRMAATRENADFLPGVVIPGDVEIVFDVDQALESCDLVCMTLPSHLVRPVVQTFSDSFPGRALVVSGSKGIENKTLLRISEVLLQIVPGLTPQRMVVLSGPSHAEEVGRAIPTAVVAASADAESARMVQESFMGPSFRVYTNNDVVGVEFGGALKNVIAIAAGISDGVGFGDNTKAALINRGIVEMTRLGVALGAKPTTFAGLSGMGDLIVTCMSRHSRNRYVGEQIGRGKTLAQVLEGMKMVAEGVRTTQSVFDLSVRTKIDMPISREVFRILFDGKDPRKAVRDLMTRDPKSEDGFG